MSRISIWRSAFVILAVLAALGLWHPLLAQDSPNTTQPMGPLPQGENLPQEEVLPSGWTRIEDDGYTRWRLDVNSECRFSDHRYVLNIPEDPQRMSDIRLTMTNFDVDYFDPQDCEGGPEFDNADLNKQPLGILAGANNSWSINSWPLTPDRLVQGDNEIYIDTDATGTGCWCVGVGYIEVQAKVGFEILETTPAANERNRDFHAGAVNLTVTFSNDVDMATVNKDTFSLLYRNQAGALQQVEGTYSQISGSKIQFRPNADLLDGVRYTVVVVGGPNGVKNINGTPLDAIYSWSFWTVPNLELTDSFDYGDGKGSRCPPSSAPCAGAEIAVFQVARNAAMIANKDSVARIYLRWKRHPNVHKDDQVKDLDVIVELDTGSGIYLATEKVRRPDQYTQGQIQAGHNSINIYHKPTGGFNYSARIKPQPQNNDVPVVYTASRNLASAGKSPTITFNHYFLKDGEWSGGVPADVKTNALNYLANGAQITLDQFPAVAVNPINKGDITFGYTYTGNNLTLTGCGTVKEVMCPIGTGLTMDEPNCIYNKMLGMRGGFHIVAITVPASVCPNSGGAALNEVLLLPPASNPVIIAHEVGHAYGISTANNPNDGHRNSPDGIEGFQVRTKTNRSRAENPANAISLMHTGPIANPSSQWIHNDDYNTLLGTVNAVQAADLSQVADPSQFHANGYLIVTGMINFDTNTGNIARPFLQKEPNELPANDGICAAVLRDASNAELSTVRFTPGVTMHTWGLDGSLNESTSLQPAAEGRQPFAISVPWDDAARTFTITCNGNTILTRQRTASPPTVSFVQPASGATLTGVVEVSWVGNDADSSGISYQLQYTDNNGETWSQLTPLIDATSFMLDTTYLSSGNNNRKLRLLATDGLNTTFTELPVKVDNPLRLLGVVPGDQDENVPVNTTIQAIFNSRIDAQTLTWDNFNVRGGRQAPTGTLSLDPTGFVATIQLIEPLENDTRYSVSINKNLRDRTGNTLDFNEFWSFTTISDTVPPFVERSSPYAGELDVPLNAYIVVQFSEEMDSFTITSENFQVVDSQNRPVAGSLRYDSDNHALVFDPENNLPPNEVFVATLSSAVTDENGNRLEQPYTWDFTTGTAEAPPTRIIGNFSERIVDTDGDGLIDVLTIYVDVQSSSGTYNLNGRLIDKSGNVIEWVSSDFGDGLFPGTLSAGVHRLALNFDARYIRANGMDGPYYLDALHFYSYVPFLGTIISSDTRYEIYATLPYSVSQFAGIVSFKPLPDRRIPWNTKIDNAWNLDDYVVSLEAPVDTITYRIVGNTDPRVGVSIDENNFIDINPEADVEARSEITVEAEDSAGNRGQATFTVIVEKPVPFALSVPSAIYVMRNETRPIHIAVLDQFEQIFTAEDVQLTIINTLETSSVTPQSVTTSNGRATITYHAGPETAQDLIDISIEDHFIFEDIAVAIIEDEVHLPNVRTEDR